MTPIRRFTKILVANRGEIAIRVMRTAREMGIATVAVYSEADAGALHVQYADEAVLVGPAPSKDSYLIGERIVEACKLTGAQAVHPGYGFLSENADFADLLRANGITLIGPSPESMRAMGNKLAAKEAVGKYDIPMVPGSGGAVTDPAEAEETANRIGYPVLIKAAAGGGGKGMRIVEKADEFAEQLGLAQREALSSFGDGSVFLERYITKPRHIEVQVLGDTHGNVVHLFERECSVQRRHQKVVEEAPSSVLNHELRARMGACAVQVAKACNYVGAGTIEFLLDENLDFFFLEMNTRLQVEHPVTEMITGIDLVREQIRIAEGEPLGYGQDEIYITGHAIEVRVYAEDPANGFLPDIGTLVRFRLPQGPGIRVDAGYEEGMEVPIYYDPMLAKLAVHAPSRGAAIARMRRAIEEFVVGGVATTLPFGRFVMEHPAFVEGDFDTKFVEKHFDAARLADAPAEAHELLGTLAVRLQKDARKFAVASDNAPALPPTSAWRRRAEPR